MWKLLLSLTSQAIEKPLKDMKMLFQNIATFHTIVCDPDNGHNADAMSSYGYALAVVTTFLMFVSFIFKLVVVDVLVEAGRYQ